MYKIKDTMFVQDLFKLTKPILKEIATNLDIDSSSSGKDQLVMLINENRDKLNPAATEIIEDTILATKSTSVSWFRFDPKISFEQFKDLIVRNNPTNPFESMAHVDYEELTTQPTLILGSTRNDESGIYLRYIYKSGVRYVTTPTSIRAVSKSNIATAYYDVELGILEVRGDSKKSMELARAVAQLLNLQVTMEQIETPFEFEIGDIADSLGGELIETTSKPELYFEEFPEEDLRSVLSVLEALDDYIKTQDVSSMEAQLQAISDTFGQGDAIVPFAALILSGLETVGVASRSEIRSLPLFNYLEPHLQHQGGFIKFPYSIDGVEDSYTVRIGMNTKSVVFVSQVTEEIIDFVRRSVIL